jgi:hypothetical protein
MISATEAMSQACTAADVYIRSAKETIDVIFGPNYAHSNPELVAAYMKVAAMDYQSAVSCGVIEVS